MILAVELLLLNSTVHLVMRQHWIRTGAHNSVIDINCTVAFSYVQWRKWHVSRLLPRCHEILSRYSDIRRQRTSLRPLHHSLGSRTDLRAERFALLTQWRLETVHPDRRREVSGAKAGDGLLLISRDICCSFPVYLITINVLLSGNINAIIRTEII